MQHFSKVNATCRTIICIDAARGNITFLQQVLKCIKFPLCAHRSTADGAVLVYQCNYRVNLTPDGGLKCNDEPKPKVQAVHFLLVAPTRQQADGAA